MPRWASGFAALIASRSFFDLRDVPFTYMAITSDFFRQRREGDRPIDGFFVERRDQFANLRFVFREQA